MRKSSLTIYLQTLKDLPSQFLSATNGIDAAIVLGSFGSSKPYNKKAFSLTINDDSNVPIAGGEKPLRYGKRPEIHHVFRPDPKSPPVAISLFFTAAVLATVPLLLGTVGIPFHPKELRC